jgi:hypothetical protein
MGIRKLKPESCINENPHRALSDRKRNFPTKRGPESANRPSRQTAVRDGILRVIVARPYRRRCYGQRRPADPEAAGECRADSESQTVPGIFRKNARRAIREGMPEGLKSIPYRSSGSRIRLFCRLERERLHLRAGGRAQAAEQLQLHVAQRRQPSRIQDLHDQLPLPQRARFADLRDLLPQERGPGGFQTCDHPFIVGWRATVEGEQNIGE